MRVLGDSRVTGKFQATIPKAVRKILELHSGDRLIFLIQHGHVLIKRGKLEIQV